LHCGAGLAQYLGRDDLLLARHNPTSVNDLDAAPAPLSLAVDPVARYTWLIAHYGAPRANEPIEQRRFAHIGPAHYDERGQLVGGVAAHGNPDFNLSRRKGLSQAEPL
jgi:hypothetical protein